MSEKTDGGAPPALPDAARLSATMAKVAEQSQRLFADFLQGQAKRQAPPPVVQDPGLFARSYQRYAERVAADPSKVIEAQMRLWQDYLALWQRTGTRLAGGEAEPVATPEPGDRRFRDPEWDRNPVFDFIKQSYLLTTRYLTSVARAAGGLDEKAARQMDFCARQLADALSPTNFAATNPAVLRETARTGGENLLRGFSNLLEDLERGGGTLQVKMTDASKFELGRNVAVTPGSVVYQNDLIQLIQYEPTTETVFERPLLVIPPWINKYYILDLRPDNSFVRWATDQGHTVYVISWVNPDASLAEKTFDDYLLEGPIAALDAIEERTGEHEANLIGYCLGGTLLASTLAWLEAAGDRRAASATFFASLVDFSEPGELGVFIDDSVLAAIERRMAGTGYLEGSEMATAFNMLRANDLIWSFVINNYLMGKEPMAFDLLYWNSDSTRMPRAMHSFYLRKMYQENLLREPGGITLANQAIDLRRVRTPAYVVATQEDHIAPWRSTYAITQLLSGPVKFVLGGSGHIAGIVNPPAAGKYRYWTGESRPESPDAWLAQATERPGSWWPDWAAWVTAQSGEQVPARAPGQDGHAVIEPAPGSYVRVRGIGEGRQ